MYSVKIESKAIQLERKTIVVTAVFTGDAGEPTITEQFSYSLDTSFEDIQRSLKRFAGNLALAQTESAKIVPNTVLDLALINEKPVPVDEDEFQKWSRQYGKLLSIDKLIQLQVLTGAEPFITTLRDKVKADFKQSFLKFM